MQNASLGMMIRVGLHNHCLVSTIDLDIGQSDERLE